MDKKIAIKTPTIIINEGRARANIALMMQKTKSQGIRFRPHFKTHQSALIGKWYQEAGVDVITVSSVKMAHYFSRNGWEDILIAFPVNLRELDEIKELASRIHLGLLIDHPDVAKALSLETDLHTDIWIKIDTGMGRAGIHWEKKSVQLMAARIVTNCSHLRLRGLLTHAGQTYHAASVEEIIRLYMDSVSRIKECQRYLEEETGKKIDVSVGDTPGCWLAEDLGEVDEVRPGNFIFFDAMMHHLGVCRDEEIALGVACPVISKYDDRLEILIHGGSVHLSKEMIENSSPHHFGFAIIASEKGQWQIREDNYVRSLSQEHGIVRLDKETYKEICIGDLITIIPVHSCLVVSALGGYLTTDGKWIEANISL
jgi:D-serine deaminase-like pyridoxal phosphate-dependent protein